VVKHWVGYGAEPEGFDGHNHYGRNAPLTDASFAQHIRAFDDSLAAHSAGVMPTYVIVHGPNIAGQPIEPVAAGFNKQMLTGLLRGEKGFSGLIVSDWSITNDCPQACMTPDAANPQTPASIGTPWGMETADKTTRFAKGLNAGIDQFGGANDPAPILDAVARKLVSEKRIDDSVRRVLRLKLEQGLFDNPYVDEAAAVRIVGNPQAQAEADTVQRASQVLLRNDKATLPVAPGKRIWLHNVDAAAARAAGFTVVEDPAQADIALVRTATPFETLHPHHFFGARQHEGRLDFRAEDKDMRAIARASARVPTVVAVEMDRPAILTAIEPMARAILVTFGASDAALLDVVTVAPWRRAICLSPSPAPWTMSRRKAPTCLTMAPPLPIRAAPGSFSRRPPNDGRHDPPARRRLPDGVGPILPGRSAGAPGTGGRLSHRRDAREQPRFRALRGRDRSCHAGRDRARPQGLSRYGPGHGTGGIAAVPAHGRSGIARRL
jgi:beta-glucosidase